MLAPSDSSAIATRARQRRLAHADASIYSSSDEARIKPSHRKLLVQLRSLPDAPLSIAAIGPVTPARRNTVPNMQ